MTLTHSARFFMFRHNGGDFSCGEKRRRMDATVAVALKISKTGRGPFTSFPFSFFHPPHFRNAFFFLSLHTYTYAQGEHCGTSNCLLTSYYGGGGGDATKPTSQEGFGGRIFVLLLFFFFFTRLFLLLLSVPAGWRAHYSWLKGTKFFPSFFSAFGPASAS